MSLSETCADSREDSILIISIKYWQQLAIHLKKPASMYLYRIPNFHSIEKIFQALSETGYCVNKQNLNGIVC